MKRRIVWLAGGLILLATVASFVVSFVTADRASGAPPMSPCNDGRAPGFHLESTIAFSSTRDNPTGVPLADAGEIYLMNPDGTNPRRLTDNQAEDAFPSLSPDGKKIVFDSDRISGQTNVSDLFLMNADGTGQTFLARGSSASWSSDCKKIVFHASTSGLGTPIRTDPGSATTDSDLFVVNLDDLLSGEAQPANITNSADKIDDDADWSPDGEHIVYTAHDVGDDPPAPPFTSNTAELYIISADGTGTPRRLTDNTYEERAAAWSPDGSEIVFACRTGGGATVFHICVKDADALATDPPQQLTASNFGDLTPTWSPDGRKILFHRNRTSAAGGTQLWLMNADGTNQAQLTSPPGINLIAHWGELRVHDQP